jgi:hypothetical protein
MNIQGGKLIMSKIIGLVSRCVVAALILPLPIWSYAQTSVTIYENDFENPNSTLCKTSIGITSSATGGTLAVDYGTTDHPFVQFNTVDRICIGATDDPGAYYDASQTAGKYAGGMVAVPGRSHVETWGLQFDPQGYDYISLSMDWSLVDLPFEPNYMPNGQPRNVVTRFYRVPAGQTFALANGGAAPAIAMLDGVAQLPFAQYRLSIQPFPASDYPGKRYRFNWQTQKIKLSLPENGFQPGDKLAVLYNLEGKSNSDWVYAAFDNYQVTASNSLGGPAPAPPATPVAVPANAPWALVLLALGAAGLGWRYQRQARRGL